MMRQFSMVLLLAGIFAVSAVQAKKPECIEPPGQGGGKGGPERVTLLHCGCADTGDTMQYVEIQVSSKSRGHLKHVAGGIESCSDGTDNFTDFVRSGSDCQINGPELDGLGFCSDDKAAMQECGTAVID
jgi:hypothetical protein